MDILRMLPLLLLLVSGSSAFNRTFKDGEGVIKVIVRTSDCHQSGTDADVSSSPGFINERGVLLWRVEMNAIKGDAGDNLERDTEQVMVKPLSKEEFAVIENACTTHAWFNQERYNDCFHANVIHFAVYTWFGNLYPAWNPGKMEVQLHIRAPNKSKWIKSVWPDANCAHNWISADDSADHYLCKNEPPYWDLKPKKAPVIGGRIACH
ncbi:hypothetical protein QR680_014858 [Steinernema hermaphroditum]|uniref:C-type lectin domain-containing protein n=1 Tax=Steinernema hermaphroditum TaxID=289476 RepID=A0AA39ICZ8_9BILA|nr:hypothetical protein QR680_014858 [Steinernema hermaphroditum]